MCENDFASPEKTMPGPLSRGRSRLRRFARRFGGVRTIYRLLVRILYGRHLRILEGASAFAPNSAGSHKLRADLTLQAVRRTFPLLREFLRLTDREILPVIELKDFRPTEEGRAAAAKLKVLFDRYGSDKATYHDYHHAYGAILARGEEIQAVLEVGMGTTNEDIASNMGADGTPGASLRAFRDYLPNAHIFGADIDRAILFRDERITTYFVDQTDLGSVHALGQQLPGELDLIIDDGLHAPDANLSILILALTKLKAGGWFLIEDIDPAAVPIWQVVASMMPSNYECSLIKADHGMLFASRRMTHDLNR